MKHWYLVYTKPRSESLAEEHLQRQGFGTYLPWLANESQRAGVRTPRVGPLFPRYLFVETDTAQQSVAPIRSTCGVSNLVTFGHRLTSVPADLIEALRESEAADGLHRWPSTEYRRGEPIQVLSGPFAGLQGVFHVASGADRVLILLDILGKTSTVQIPRARIAPAALV